MERGSPGSLVRVALVKPSFLLLAVLLGCDAGCWAEYATDMPTMMMPAGLTGPENGCGVAQQEDARQIGV